MTDPKTSTTDRLPANAAGESTTSGPTSAGPVRTGESWTQLLLGSAVWVPVLVLQAVLALRVNGPISTDESLYLVAGHRLLDNMLTGAPVQDYGTWFSGVPGLYPVLGGAVDQLGGIVAARALGLLCMLWVNLCLYLITARLFGRMAGVFASATFALTSAVSFLSWYATFDAPSLALLATATLLVFQLAERPGWTDRAALLQLVGAGAALALAVAVKYFALEFVPVVLALLAIRTWRQHGRRAAVIRVAGVLGVAILVGGTIAGTMSSSNWSGFSSTSSTGRRILDQVTGAELMLQGVEFIGLWLVLAVAGLIVNLGRRTLRLESLVMLGAGFMPIATHVMLNESTSLHKHTGFGYFFAAPLAGVAVVAAFGYGRGVAGRYSALNGAGSAPDGLPESKVRPPRRRRSVTAVVPVAVGALLAVMLGTGMASAAQMNYGWPEEASLVEVLDPLVDSSGHYLAETASIPAYLFGDRTLPDQWTSPWYFAYSTDGTMIFGNPALQRAVADEYFDAIVLRPGTFDAEQQQLLMPVIGAHYQLVAQVQYWGGNQWQVFRPLRSVG